MLKSSKIVTLNVLLYMATKSPVFFHKVYITEPFDMMYGLQLLTFHLMSDDLSSEQIEHTLAFDEQNKRCLLKARGLQ